MNRPEALRPCGGDTCGVVVEPREFRGKLRGDRPEPASRVLRYDSFLLFIIANDGLEMVCRRKGRVGILSRSTEEGREKDKME